MSTIDQLMIELHRQRFATAKELTASLGISQSQLSRLVRSAGTRLCKIGRARATSYSATRSLGSLGTVLPVRRIDEEGRVHDHGKLHLLAHGGHWLTAGKETGPIFDGLPPFAWDMAPQGYLGAGFSVQYPELEVPARLTDWSDDHRLLALARRGEDCVGNLILGDESLNRFLASETTLAPRSHYPLLARAAVQDRTGSSAGGEHPKFLACTETGHALVKFALAGESEAARRNRDLLACEAIALETIRAAGGQAASCQLLDIDGDRFLEIARFDRTGVRGRIGTLSLFALHNEYVGDYGPWTKQAMLLHDRGFIDGADAQRLRWLDTFGQQIANTDRHMGNITFFTSHDGRYRLAPAYDMLPMNFAPAGADVIDRGFKPGSPTANNLDVWTDATHWALKYWERLIDCSDLSSAFQRIASKCREVLAAAAARYPG